MSTHFDKKFAMRKCLDCPTQIHANGGKKRCPTCAVANINKIQRQSDERRRAKKRQQGAMP